MPAATIFRFSGTLEKLSRWQNF